MNITEYKYLTVEGDPMIVGELYERRDGIVVPCRAIYHIDPDRPIRTGDGFRSYLSNGAYLAGGHIHFYDLMRRHVLAVADHSGDDAEMVQAVGKALFDEEYGLTTSWAKQPESVHEQYFDLARAAINTVRKFKGKSDGK